MPTRRRGGAVVIGRRGEGTPPYGYFEDWCHRDDVGIAPYEILPINSV